jgi:hypothetical protein
MQKINICSIVIRHFGTLRNARGGFPLSDALTFVVVPILFGAVLGWAGVCISASALELSTTVFSVFAALLLSVQVALYSVSLRQMQKPTDAKLEKHFESVKTNRRLLIKELNDNISYLILLSVLYITIFLGAYIWGKQSSALSGVIAALYLHFLFTLLMVVKRASIVFSREYET